MPHNPFTVPQGTQVRLIDHDPGDTGSLKSEDDARSRIAQAQQRLAHAQDLLFANQSWTLLVVLQGMDAAGKDETIEGMLSYMSPQGSSVAVFKEPGGKEVTHDYLWRFVAHLPERGQVGIFNRSYYEEVLSSRVRPEKLAQQPLPAAIRESPDIWDQRFRQINNFEQYLVENGILVLKFFLHVSKGRQRQRLLERLTSDDKQWQFSWSDIEDRQQWDQYMAAYEEVHKQTSTAWAPWHIIPSDHRWYSGLVVGEVIADTIEALKLRYPQGSEQDQQARMRAQALLEAEQ